MVDFYIVTGGTGSNKHLVGMGLARKYSMPLLFGESFYSTEQFELACTGTPFDIAESTRWASGMCDAMIATGRGVLVCKPLDGSELPIWEACGCIFVVHADATAEKMIESWTTEQNVLNRTGMPGRPCFNQTTNIQDVLTRHEHSVEAADKAVIAAGKRAANLALVAAYRANPEGMDRYTVMRAVIALRDERIPPLPA